jgi:RNA polymerase sigma factor (sigma-70 family)
MYSAAMQRVAEGARKRAALETYVTHEPILRRTARRYSLCDDDADDALQRALEILLTKAPSEDPRELVRWTQTVVKHEALAVRRERERILSGPAARKPEPGREDWVALLPSDADGPPERAERREAIARSREALRTLKPQELRALTLLAEGYSYAEIGEITGYSHTKINRCLAEGRERFRKFLARSEAGGRCEEMGGLLSAFCDGESSREEAAAVREHLRACASCRAALRAYRAAPRAAAALAPVLALGRSPLERLHDAFGDLVARFGGRGGGDAALSGVAAGGGAGGAGVAGVAKAVLLCAGAAAGGAACVATGLVPDPLGTGREQAQAPALERRVDSAVGAPQASPARSGRAEAATAEPSEPAPDQGRPSPIRADAPPAASAAEPEPPPAPAEPEPVPVAQPAGESAAGGSPAGEFGP